MLDDNGTFRRGLRLCEDEQGVEEDEQEVEVELEEGSGVDERGIRPMLAYVRKETADLLHYLDREDQDLHALAEQFGNLACAIIAEGHWQRLLFSDDLERFEEAMDKLFSEKGVWKQLHLPNDRDKRGAIRNMPEITRHILRIHWVVASVRNEVDDDLMRAFSAIRVNEINLMDYKFLAVQKAANDSSKPKVSNSFQKFRRGSIVKTFPIHRAYEAEEDEAPKNNVVRIDFTAVQNNIEKNKVSNERPKHPILFRNFPQSPVKKGFRVKRFKLTRFQEDTIES